jgi:hypothetical protein
VAVLAAALSAWGREEMPRGRARARSRARAAPRSEGGQGGCTAWPGLKKIGGGGVEQKEQRNRGSSRRKKKGRRAPRT